MTTPAEVKFELERQLLARVRDGHMPLKIVGIHRVVTEGNMVSVGYDCDDGVFFFEFERPVGVSANEVAEFSMWLAQVGRCDCDTLH